MWKHWPFLDYCVCICFWTQWNKMTNEFLSVICGSASALFIYRFIYTAFLVVQNATQCNTTYFCTAFSFLSRHFAGILYKEYMNKIKCVGCRMLRCEDWVNHSCIQWINIYYLYLILRHSSRQYRDDKFGDDCGRWENIWAFGAGQSWGLNPNSPTTDWWSCSHHWISWGLDSLCA